MPSQTDLDQGGTYRQYVRRFLGPSVGWVWTPEDNVLPITGASGAPIQGTTLVTVNYNGAVSIQLPSAKSSTVPAGAQPGTYLALPMTIVDIGGYASDAQPITLLPFGTEKIMSLASYLIQNPYGAITLAPNISAGGWNQQ